MIKSDQVKSNVRAKKARIIFCPYCSKMQTSSCTKGLSDSFPLNHIQKLKMDLDLFNSELRTVQAELNTTKQKLKAVIPSSALVDIDILNTIMQQIHAINEKLESNIDPKALAKQVIKEVLNPLKTSRKLSKSDQIRLAAAAKTDRDNLKLIQKQARNNKYREF